MPSPSPLEQLRRLDRSSSKFHDLVCNILYGREYLQWVPTIEGKDLVGLVDYLDTALDSLHPTSPAFRRCLRELRHICGDRTILPPSYTLSSQDFTVGRQPVASGGSGDVYEGWLNGSKVCVKRVRVYSKDGPKKATKTLYQEAVVWKRLEHQNIVPLLGITPNPLQIVSGWMFGGDLTEYIKKYPATDRLSLLSDVVEGLHFLHSHNIIHGDLKGPNILVDDTGHARITDFGLATVDQSLDSIRTTLENRGYTVRWTAPEILTKEGTYSKESDVFSFAMVMIEVFTGAVPFRDKTLFEAHVAIMTGGRPPRPTHQNCTDELWALVQRCWNQDPYLRPEVSEAANVLRGPEPSLIEPSICHSLNSASLRSFGGSVEIPALRTSPDDEGWDDFMPSPDLLPLDLAEVDAECKRQPGQELIDRLDTTLDRMACDENRYKLLNILCKMCSRQRMIPKSMHMDEHLNGELVEEYDGGHAIISRTQHNGRQVAVKTVRIYLSSDFDKCFSEFCREAVAWRHLRHPNILPLLGVDLEQHRLAMISEWMDQGNINEFVKRYDGVNRVQLLVEAANGLEYMHSSNMVHGDLKGANILINKSRRACLADFGLSTVASVEHRAIANASVVSVVSKPSLMSFTAGGTPRWMSPELLDPDRFGAGDDRPTKQSDCYAFGMVVYEVLCGKPPYWEITNPWTVIHAITEGERPKRPEAAETLGFTKELWRVVRRCWLVDTGSRPDVKTILSHLNHATWSWGRRQLV